MKNTLYKQVVVSYYKVVEMADALALAVRSGIFGVRNTQKEYREPVVFGQAARVVENVSKLDSALGKETQAAIEAFRVAANGSKVLEYTGKAAKLASTYINPLICASAVVKVAKANPEERDAVLVTNAAALGSMFAVEKLMKNHLDKTIDSVKEDVLKMQSKSETVEKVVKFLQKVGKGKLTPIIKGVAFVAGSCLAYSAGEGFGKLLMGDKAQKETKAKELKAA